MFCNRCGCKLPEGSNYCLNCGAKVKAPSDNPVAYVYHSQTQASNSTKSFPRILIIIGIIITIGIFWYTTSSGSSSYSSSSKSSGTGSSSVSYYTNRARSYMKTGHYHNAMKAIYECYDEVPGSRSNSECEEIIDEIRKALKNNEPQNGKQLARTFQYMGGCILNVTAQSGSMVVRIYDKKNPSAYCEFYVRKGKSAETSVTAGTYRISYKIGDLWFNDNIGFGDFCEEGSFEEDFVFKNTTDNAWITNTQWNVTI